MAYGEQQSRIGLAPSEGAQIAAAAADYAVMPEVNAQIKALSDKAYHVPAEVGTASGALGTPNALSSLAGGAYANAAQINVLKVTPNAGTFSVIHSSPSSWTRYQQGSAQISGSGEVWSDDQRAQIIGLGKPLFYGTRAALLPDQEGRQRTGTSEPTFRGRVAGPVNILLAIFDRWHVSDGDAAILLGETSGSFIADLRVGTSTLRSRDMRDRASLLINIYEGVRSLLQSPETERSWIKAPLSGMNNESLFDRMRRGSISDLYFVKSFVDDANGR